MIQRGYVHIHLDLNHSLTQSLYFEVRITLTANIVKYPSVCALHGKETLQRFNNSSTAERNCSKPYEVAGISPSSQESSLAVNTTYVLVSYFCKLQEVGVISHLCILSYQT